MAARRRKVSDLTHGQMLALEVYWFEYDPARGRIYQAATPLVRHESYPGPNISGPGHVKGFAL